MGVTMVPQSLSKPFFEVLLKDISYVEDNGLFYVDCSQGFLDVFFMVSDRWVQIKSEDMILDISDTQDMSLCIVNFIPSVDDFWVFGNSIYKDYYVTHKPESAILGFTPTEKQRKEPLYQGNRPVEDLALGYNWWMMLAKFVASACVGMGTWVCMKYIFDSTTISFLDKGEIASD